jgi:hypothetical protein
LNKISLAVALCAALVGSAHAEFITNGSFSDPSTVTQTGWSTTSTSYSFGSGQYSESGGFGTLFQTIQGATGNLTLSFNYSSFFGYQETYFDGVSINIFSGSTPSNRYSFSVVGTGHDLLQFKGAGGIGATNLSNVSLIATPVPEPETYAMLLAGLGLVGATVKRRKAKQA